MSVLTRKRKWPAFLSVASMTRIQEGLRHALSALRQRTRKLIYRTPIVRDLYFGLKQVIFQIPVISDLIDYRYDYMFTPAQLAFLCEQITNIADVPGSILEVGCETGKTTVFLNRHIDSLGMIVDYHAIDTFSGFTSDDLESERSRGRDYWYFPVFRGNSKSRFDRTMRRNRVRRVTSFQTDANTFDYSTISPFRMVFVDLDLYRPVLLTLNAIYDLVSPGGLIVIDDCEPGGPQEGASFEGAYEALVEFTKAKGMEPVVAHGKLGVITKPRTSLSSVVRIPDSAGFHGPS
jgi:hypothetical protein